MGLKLTPDGTKYTINGREIWFVKSEGSSCKDCELKPSASTIPDTTPYELSNMCRKSDCELGVYTSTELQLTNRLLYGDTYDYTTQP